MPTEEQGTVLGDEIQGRRAVLRRDFAFALHSEPRETYFPTSPPGFSRKWHTQHHVRRGKEADRQYARGLRRLPPAEMEQQTVQAERATVNTQGTPADKICPIPTAPPESTCLSPPLLAHVVQATTASPWSDHLRPLTDLLLVFHREAP